jgi:hypothetical protein
MVTLAMWPEVAAPLGVSPQLNRTPALTVIEVVWRSMSSRHLVDPDLIGLLELWPETEFTLQTLALIRLQSAHSHRYLVYPMLDDRTCTRPQPHLYTGEFLWTAEKNAFGWSCLLGTDPGGDGVSPLSEAPSAQRIT